MTSDTTVLVTGVGACGVGEGIAKAVRMADKYTVVAVNVDANAPELFEADHRYLVPRATDTAYVPAISSICHEHGVQFILPGSEPEALALAREKQEFAEKGVSVIVNPFELVETCQDKWLAFEAMSSAGLPTPLTLRPYADPDFRSSLELPIILKPRRGHASKNVFLAHTEEELDAYLGRFHALEDEPVAQQYIPGNEEFTCSALVGEDGAVLGSIAMRRELMGGFSQRVEVGDFPEATNLTERVATALGAAGPINVQCRFWESQFWVFEINARFSGSAPFRAMVGFNEPDMAIQYALTGQRPSFSVVDGLIGMRRLEEVLVSVDTYRDVEWTG